MENEGELTLKEYYEKYFPFDVVIYFLCCGRVSEFPQIEKSFGWEPMDSENEGIYKLLVCDENMKYCGVSDEAYQMTRQETEMTTKEMVIEKDSLTTGEEVESNEMERDVFLQEGITGKHIWRHMYCSTDYFQTCVLKHVPHRIDVGPMYPILSQNEDGYKNYKQKLRAVKTKLASLTMLRPLIFDLDLSDAIKEYRDCDCSDKQVCDRCWFLVRDAVIFIRDILTGVFGYQMLYVFASGGRGAHIWVHDHSATTLTKNERQIIVDYLLEHSRAPHYLPLLLDANLTYSMNHLCRCPFSVHNRSGNICCPINDIENFLPSQLPSIKNTSSIIDFYNSTDTSPFFLFCESIGFQNIE